MRVLVFAAHFHIMVAAGAFHVVVRMRVICAFAFGSCYMFFGLIFTCRKEPAYQDCGDEDKKQAPDYLPAKKGPAQKRYDHNKNFKYKIGAGYHKRNRIDRVAPLIISVRAIEAAA